jgi:hypothetical protein
MPPATPPPPPKSGPQLLDQYYLDLRCHLLELAAGLDRLDRAGGAAADPRLQRLRHAATFALDANPDRVRRILEFLSA